MASLPPGVDPCSVPVGQNPHGSPPNFQNPESLSTATIAVGSVMIFLTTLFVGARICINWRKMKWSDYFTIVAFILQTGFTGILISLHQFNRHLWDIPACWMTTSYLKRLYAHSLLFGFTLFFSKAAIFLLYLEIFGSTRKTRRLIWAGLIFAAVLYSTFIPLDSVYTAPAAGQSWDALFAQIADLSKARVILYWSLGIGAGSILLDFYIFAIPIPILKKLHVSNVKRLQLIAVFGTALLGVVASVVALAYRVYLITDPLDGTWHQASVGIANMIENDVAIIVGSMPSFSHFIRDRVAGSSLLKSIVTALRSTHDGGTTGKSSKFNRSWPSPPKRPYVLKSRPHSEDGIGLTGLHRGLMQNRTTHASVEGSWKIGPQHGQEPGGIIRTVDVFQHVQYHPESTDNLV
ncbi:hypothetical protein F4859DRAFT_457543 [Xylaria cf. heliscus]|nr:hypothetical protein F4859DRAFT_457543 [Xylaria cf. heliscus]